MDEQNKTPEDQTWGTLEELLLASAINRYGTTSWDSVSTQLQKRFSPLFTPHFCRQKYLDLKLRFTAGQNSGDDPSFWLEELRKRRVDELRRDLQRFDLSIGSLQLKVKRLKEGENPDLQSNLERERVTDGENKQSGNFAGGELERKFDSGNVSISSKPEPELAGEPESDKMDGVGETKLEEDSYNGSSNAKEKAEGEKDRVDSAGLTESVAESKEVKENSDVLSTARRDKKVGLVSENSSGEENQSAAVKTTGKGESQPLINLLEIIRGQKLGSVFQRRLECQETPKYRNLIRQHIDLGMIQKRLESGQYADCHTKFYRDLMLLINNTIVFFSNKSLEHKAALELRKLITKQSQSHSNPHKSQPIKPNPTPSPPKPPKSEPNSADHTINVKPKLALTGPVIACRKRSSIAGKPSTMVGEKTEPPSVTQKTSSSLNAITKERTRDEGFGSKSSSSKNNSSGNKSMCHPSPTHVLSQQPRPSTPASAKGDKRKPSLGNSVSKVKRGSGSGNVSLLALLKNPVEQRKGNKSNEGSKGDKHKELGLGSRNELANKAGKGKGKTKEEGSMSKSNERLTKRAPPVNRKAESLPRKRQRK